MAVVATSLDLPIKIEWPYLQDVPVSRCTMLGLGDMVLPGLFVSFTYKFDLQKGTNVYYWANLIGYVIGLVICVVFLIMLNMAQPALLYIVPCTLGAVYLVGLKRGEVRELWKGLKSDTEYKNNLIRTSERSDSNVLQLESDVAFEMRRREVKDL